MPWVLTQPCHHCLQQPRSRASSQPALPLSPCQTRGQEHRHGPCRSASWTRAQTPSCRFY